MLRLLDLGEKQLGISPEEQGNVDQIFLKLRIANGKKFIVLGSIFFKV